MCYASNYYSSLEIHKILSKKYFPYTIFQYFPIVYPGNFIELIVKFRYNDSIGFKVF